MNNYYQELAQYTNRDIWLVTQRCQTARFELAWLWEEFKNDPIKYYRETDLYLFDLSMYQTVLQEQGFHKWLEGILKDFQIKTCLDFGGGIGEYAIITCKNGVKTDYLEIENSKTLEYAKHRFKTHNVNPGIFGLNDTFGKYDLIISMDVFEHIENNASIVEEVAKKCTYMICNTPEEIPYGPLYPQHISRIDNIREHFEQVTGRLWRSKK